MNEENMSKTSLPYKILIEFSRLLVGLVFIFSGFVKGVDPTGSVYKFEDYFTAFHLDVLHGLAFPLAMGLIMAEFLIGMALVFGVKIRWAAWGALVFMILFTPLTLILALTNPVSDCGCFGDALVLTNWQTFIKNLFILFFTLVTFLGRHHYKVYFYPLAEWFILGAFALFMIGIANYGLKYLPVIDFRPYSVGTSIPDDRTIPEGMPQDEYETVLIYEKDGERREFSMDNFPWQDSSWTFIDQRSYLVKEGYRPPIHDFNILAPDGEDITDIVLSKPNYVYLVVASHLSESSMAGMKKATELMLYCQQYDQPFYVLSASSPSEIKTIQNALGMSFDVHSLDETTLKTMIRSNPGLMILKDGVILDKMAWRSFPTPDALSGNHLSESLMSESQGKSIWRIYGLFLSLVFIFMLSQYRFRILHRPGPE